MGANTNNHLWQVKMKFILLLSFFVGLAFSHVSLASDAICSVAKGKKVIEKDHKFPYDDTFEVKDIIRQRRQKESR